MCVYVYVSELQTHAQTHVHTCTRAQVHRYTQTHTGELHHDWVQAGRQDVFVQNHHTRFCMYTYINAIYRPGAMTSWSRTITHASEGSFAAKFASVCRTTPSIETRACMYIYVCMYIHMCMYTCINVRMMR